ncbi:MAG: uridine kinase [bacterium]|nr:MAG: uridine kinase [bacterium]
MQPFVIGIAGGSCSGKTGLAGAVAGGLEGRETVIVQIDSYYFDLAHLKEEERARQNFDLPGAVDFELLAEHLRSLLAGDEVLVPVYDFATHTRVPSSLRIRNRLSGSHGGSPIVIVEGLHALYREDIRALMNLKIFVECSFDTCLTRRIERDTRERGRTPAGVRKQWEQTVVPMYRKYVEPVIQYADLIIDGEEPVDESARKVIERIQPYRGTNRETEAPA